MVYRIIISRKDIERLDLKCQKLKIKTLKLSKIIQLICDYNINFQQKIIERHEDFFEYLQAVHGEKLPDSNILKEVLIFYKHLCQELKKMEVELWDNSRTRVKGSRHQE